MEVQAVGIVYEKEGTENEIRQKNGFESRTSSFLSVLDGALP